MKPKRYTLTWDRWRIELGAGRTCLMGILNVTPDSFSDGGEYFTLEDAVAQGLRLEEAGADILDIGGESTRPFSEPVAAEEEIRRVCPVIESLAKRLSIPISIDTTKAAVARSALDAGATIVNDIAALRFDPDMAPLAAERKVPVILMHMLGTPKTMQVDPHYDDVIEDIRAFLKDAVQRAIQAGIPKDRIVVDPGIGFGKTLAHNLNLIRRLGELASLDCPILMGPSRKSFVRNILKQHLREGTDPDRERIIHGTMGAVAACILNGAHILRVHDVARIKPLVEVIDAIQSSEG